VNTKELAEICRATEGLPTYLDLYPSSTVATISIGALCRLASAVESHTLNEVCREMQEYAVFEPAAGPAALVKAFADALRKPSRGYQFVANAMALCLYGPDGRVTANMGVEWEDHGGREEIVLHGSAPLFSAFADFIEWAAANPCAGIEEVVAQLEALGIHNR